MATTTSDSLTFKNGYSEVNGLKMYYEIHGQGKPIVLIHGGGSTIQTNFEKIIPLLAKNRQVMVLDRMLELKFINQEEYDTFIAKKIDVAVKKVKRKNLSRVLECFITPPFF